MIRPMRTEDLDAVVGIDLASFVDDRPLASDAAQLRRDQLREELGRAWARLRVSTDEQDRPVGYLLSWHVVDEVHILNVAVTPGERQKGRGTALVRDLVAEADRTRASKVLLEVRASNQLAMAIYERLGFVRFHVRPRYYDDGEDGVEMMRTFPLRS